MRRSAAAETFPPQVRAALFLFVLRATAASATKTAGPAATIAEMIFLYLSALVASLGILLLQIAMGGKDVDAHGGDAGEHGEHDHAGVLEPSIVALFLSTRFWVFTSLGFGLSGVLMHVLELAGPLAVACLAAVAGLGSGIFAVVVFRTVMQKATTTTTTTHATDAVGKVGRVLVACQKGEIGQVRVELKGHSVDFLATTDEDEIPRGEHVLVVEMRESTAHVARRPPELS
jgi:membrane protein implicated in regulation of membrane protease activity